jgi:small nuclear ribonucleoprotein (snRNP)-like protein
MQASVISRVCPRKTYALLLCVLTGLALARDAAGPASGLKGNQRYIGTVKSLDDTGFILTSDLGQDSHVTLTDSTRMVRIAPGEKDLKNAAPLQKKDLQPGDRVLVGGLPVAAGASHVATSVVVMKQADITAKKDQQREDWRQRGVGGLVTAIDQASGTITISVASFAGSKPLLVRTSKNTYLRRYAPNSVKFDDAKFAPLDQIKVGDQLRARGNKNPEGTELNAEEIVSGTFRNLAGQITAVDTATNTIILKDAISRQTAVVKVTPDSQLRKLPPEFAQRIAARLKSAAAEGIPGANSALGGGGGQENSGGQGQTSQGRPAGGMGARAGNFDVQQILNRMPATSLSDLQKGDAVMIVSTAGDGSQPVSAITMLAGVEPILTAVPNASQAILLSPWTLGPGNAEAAANP